MCAQRYAYIKNGDPIDQLKELAADPRDIPQGGPNAFIADLLHMLRDDEVLILSGVERNRAQIFGRISVQTFASHLSKGNLLKKALLRIVGVTRLSLALYRFRPDVIICGKTQEILWLSWLVARLRGAAMIHSRHNRVDAGKERSWIGRLYSYSDRLVIRRCDAVVCHGPYLRDQLVGIGVTADRIFEFDSGFADFFARKELRTGVSGTGSRRMVLFVGRIEQAKGVFDLFAAMLDRLLEDETTGLMYIGDGSALVQLRALVASHGLGERVEFAGRINHERLPDYLCGAYLLVMPTRSTFPEGRCMSVMEGLVMGLPVIAPDFGPFPYLIDDHVNGLLYQPDSVQQLGNAINLLLDDDDLYRALSSGARATGERLKNAPASFASAVAAALGFIGRTAPVAKQ